MTSFKVAPNSKIAIYTGDEITHTKVNLKTDDKFNFIECLVIGDHRNTADDVLLQLALDAFHTEHFANREITETTKLVKELEAKAKELDGAIAENKRVSELLKNQADTINTQMEEDRKKMEEQINNSKVAQQVLMELTTQLIMGGVVEVSDDMALD